MAKKFIAPNLDNATPTSILDEMGTLSLMESQIKKLRGFYKEAYYARTGIKLDDPNFPAEGITKEGEIFIATTTKTSPERVSTTLVREKYPEVANECTVSLPQLTTRFVLREGVTNPVVNDLLEQLKKELDLD